MFDTIYRLVMFSQDSSIHFALAFSVGALAYSATSIMSIALFVITEQTGRTISRRAVVIGTVLIPLLLALSLALLSHYGLDYWSTWLDKPLGPSLTICIIPHFGDIYRIILVKS